MRNLMTNLRSVGVITSGGSGFSKTDCYCGLSALDTIVVKAQNPRPYNVAQ